MKKQFITPEFCALGMIFTQDAIGVSGTEGINNPDRAPKRNAGAPAQHAAVSVDPTAAVPNGLEH